MVRYFVCLPLDLPDARRTGQQSALQRWNKNVEKWNCWAHERQMSVDFILWGSSELIDRLLQPRFIRRVSYWFGGQHFDEEWFYRNSRQAIKATGKRYTPELHVDLPIARDIALFGRTESALNQIKALAKDIRSSLSYIRHASSGDDESSHEVDLANVSRSVGIEELIETGKAVLSSLSLLNFEPTDDSPLTDSIERIEAARVLGERIIESLDDIGRERKGRINDDNQTPYTIDPIDKLRDSVTSFRFTVESASNKLCHAEIIVNSYLMVVEGMAGTGKTHLLCDTSRLRNELGSPTVLLLGQHFTTTATPWTQVLQQLELHNITVEEFVGGLECAAQASNCRALIVIDALNEGEGPKIWFDHLSAFLEQLESSPWIAVLLSVRSSYSESIVPDDVRSRATVVEHQGFNDHEYDAVASFFSHYRLELPSTPILPLEFSNPLLLKMLCEGLNSRGETKLPRGLNGITELFGFYLESVNERLARVLDYDSDLALVQDAVLIVAKHIDIEGHPTLPKQSAQRIVDQLLPNRSFVQSLYRGLVTEGVLLEDVEWKSDGGTEKVTSITYERLADHIIASLLLKTQLGLDDTRAASELGSGLNLLTSEAKNVRAGLLEALCIQVPELTGKELFRLAPTLKVKPFSGRAIRQSIIWRKLEAFSDDTLVVLNEFLEHEGAHKETLDVLLTVATVDKHPFNAKFLDRNLRRYSMPDRDEWWSTYLHHSYQTNGAVDRLLDWALDSKTNSDLEDKTIDLSVTTLAWMLTTSNRFLRDRATKALVSLLSSRLDAVVRLVERFSNVEDSYVTERVFAVAYGVAMRSRDAKAVGQLAIVVYERIFADGNPPPHILLRDYARGVIERALYLGCELQIDEQAIRPPYESCWPTIPDEKTMEHLEPDYDRKSYARGRLEWAWHSVYSSVMRNDFARYVIGTNFKQTNWLSLRQDEDPWQSPEDRTKAWVSKLSDKEVEAWNEYREKKSSQPIRVKFGSGVDDKLGFYLESKGEGKSSIEAGSLTEQDKQRIEQARLDLESARHGLLETLTAGLRTELESIWQAESEEKPYFDLCNIQRYVLCRVIELGWTVERFGQFDLYSVRDRGRDAAKPERIGKKYQWIAYHEILAHIADHYQYRGRYGEDDSDKVYEGPWQENFRDIDPSCTLERIPGVSSWDGPNPSWWANCEYEDWDEGIGHEAWIEKREDLPVVSELLSVIRPKDGSRWLNAAGFLLWRQPSPADLEPDMVDKRELWLRYSGYFIPSECASDFMDWAKCADTWGIWLHEPSGVQDFYLGEYGWAQAFKHIFKPFYGHSDWEDPEGGCPTSVRPAFFPYAAEAGTSDCSIEETFSLRLPHHDFVAELGLRWSGKGVDFCDQHGDRVAYDPTVHEDGPSALLLREDCVRRYLAQNNLALIWVVQGEKSVLGKGWDGVGHGYLEVTGAFLYTDGKPNGSLRYRFNAP